MSLIEEALRRIQDPVSDSAKAATASQTAESVQPQDVKRPTPAGEWSTSSTPPLVSPSPFMAAAPSKAPIFIGGVVVALAMVLLVGGGFWMGNTLGERKPEFDTGPTITKSTQPAPIPVSHTMDVEQQPKPESPEAIAQPQRPPRTRKSAATSSPHPLTLHGVMEGLGEPYAVIDGMIVGVGDRVGDATLLKIANGSVTLRYDDGKEHTLQITR